MGDLLVRGRVGDLRVVRAAHHHGIGHALLDQVVQLFMGLHGDGARVLFLEEPVAGFFHQLGAVRLSVLLDAADSAGGCNVPAAPGAVGVVHGVARAKLDPAHAQRIIAITDEGDGGLIALAACQAYAREITD